MPRPTTETIQAITANWNDLWPRLLMFTEKRIAKMYWRGCLRGPIPGGLESKDVVLIAIGQAVSGERKWNENIDLYTFLCGAIASNLSHLANGSENKTTILTRVESEDDNYNKYNIDSPECLNDAPHITYELIQKYSIVNRFLDNLKDDSLVYGVACYILYYSIDKPSDLAESLKTTVSDINNAKKRLRRRLSEWEFLISREENSVLKEGGDSNVS
jgi:hypothetical protein